MFNGIKKVRKLLDDQYWRAKQEYLNYYEKLPLDEKAILLESEHGKKLDGNIFYLIRYMATSKRYKDYKIYLCALGRNKRKFSEFSYPVLVSCAFFYIGLYTGDWHPAWLLFLTIPVYYPIASILDSGIKRIS